MSNVFGGNYVAYFSAHCRRRFRLYAISRSDRIVSRGKANGIRGGSNSEPERMLSASKWMKTGLGTNIKTSIF